MPNAALFERVDVTEDAYQADNRDNWIVFHHIWTVRPAHTPADIRGNFIIVYLRRRELVMQT